jgi:hypothetical protein
MIQSGICPSDRDHWGSFGVTLSHSRPQSRFNLIETAAGEWILIGDGDAGGGANKSDAGGSGVGGSIVAVDFPKAARAEIARAAEKKEILRNLRFASWLSRL